MQQAIIIGGGIGGLTAAIALRQKGIDVTVYEQAPVLAEVGAGVWVAPNGLKVFKQLGIADSVIAAGRFLDAIRVVDKGGKVITKVDVSRMKEKHGFATLAIHRARLQNALYNQLPQDKVITGKRFVSYGQNGNKVKAFFEDGSVAEGDLLIAADGIHSRARAQIVPNVPLRYSGQTCWRFITGAPPGATSQPNNMHEIWGAGKGLRAAYSLISETELYCYITVFTEAGRKDNPATLRNELLTLCCSFPPIITDLIRTVDLSKVIRTDLYDFKPIRKWTDGHVALLGDAAHATTPNLGQGACQAIEDAICIAQELSNHDDIPKAFAAYQARRMAKATYITNTSWQFSRLTNTTGFTKRAVQQVLRMTPEFVNEKQLDKIYNLS